MCYFDALEGANLVKSSTSGVLLLSVSGVWTGTTHARLAQSERRAQRDLRRVYVYGVHNQSTSGTGWLDPAHAPYNRGHKVAWPCG